MYKSVLFLCITYATFILSTTSAFVAGVFYLESSAVFPTLFMIFGLFSVGLAACILELEVFYPSEYFSHFSLQKLPS